VASAAAWRGGWHLGSWRSASRRIISAAHQLAAARLARLGMAHRRKRRRQHIAHQQPSAASARQHQ
jgi:hypothetical protein